MSADKLKKEGAYYVGHEWELCRVMVSVMGVISLTSDQAICSDVDSEVSINW